MLYILIGNVYITDSLHQRIRKVTISTGIINTIVGSGGTSFSDGSYNGDGIEATSATLNTPYGVALDLSGKSNYSLLFSLLTRCIL